MVVEIGEQAPDFIGTAHNGDIVSLSDYKGKTVVLYFYPRDMTPGCTTEACNFRDHHENFIDLNTVIIGVSPDPVKRHKKFIQKHDLPFFLLADEDHQIAEKYGAWKLKKIFGKEYYGMDRSTFIIDQEGILAQAYRKVKVKGHIKIALNYIRDHLQ